MKAKQLFYCETEKAAPLAAAFNLLLVCVVVVIVFWVSLATVGVSFNFSFLADFKTRILGGFSTTVKLSAASLFVSLIIGGISAFGQGSKILFVRYFFGMYVSLIRGTPLIMQIYLFFYILGTAWGITNRFVAGVLILSIFEGAYIAEIIRGGYISLEESQLEAAKAVGFTRIQTVKYVILPQMMARTLPSLTGQFASIIKDSSLLSMIALIELTQTMREISASNFMLFECYLFLGVLYLTLTLPLSILSKQLEKRFDYEN